MNRWMMLFIIMFFLAGCEKGKLEESTFIFEAEAGSLNGVGVVAKGSGYSGEGYVTGFEQAEDSVTIIVHSPLKGLYQLWVGYNGPNGDKVTQLSLNGSSFGELHLAETTEFVELSAGKVLLNKGDNEIKLTSGWGWYDIDYVKIQKAEQRAKHQVENVLVNPNASPEALELHGFLVEQYGKSILSGQQTLKNALELKRDYAIMPAVAGFDLMEYSPTRVEHGASADEVEDMLMWHDLGGIVTLAWHWNAPTELINSAEQPWWKGFYTEGTTFDIAETLMHLESENYQLLIRDIDAIAVQLKILQEHKIPVLWRPLHEAEGGWFWWGAKGAEPTKELWKLLYDRLTNHHQINNLIWVWNSEAPEWYPGDDVVDIVSIDTYTQPGDYNPISNRYDHLVELVKDKKLVAMTENGPIPDPDMLEDYQAHWSWFCTWTEEFIKDGKHNSKEHIQHVLNHEYVITLDELNALRKQQ